MASANPVDHDGGQADDVRVHAVGPMLEQVAAAGTEDAVALLPVRRHRGPGTGDGPARGELLRSRMDGSASWPGWRLPGSPSACGTGETRSGLMKWALRRMGEGVDVPTTRQKRRKPGSRPTRPAGPGLNELTIRRQGSRALTPAQEQAYLLLCAGADRLSDHDLAAVEVMHAQACTMDAPHDGVPVVVTAAYDLVETILRNEIVDADRECTCWLAAALRAFDIRNTVSRAMLMHSLLTLAGHPMVTAQARQKIRTQFGGRRAEVTPKAVAGSVASTLTLVDASVVGGVMVAALIQDTLEMAGMGPFKHG